jgi:uncharacterized membrane protein HdeD (DUF308 family)
LVRFFRLVPLVWSILGFPMFLSGFYSGSAVTATLGVAIVFAGVSNFLTLHFASENKLKRALEVFSAVGAVGIIFCGYFSTGSIILAIITALVIVLMSVVFLLSQVLPKIRSKRQTAETTVQV